MRFILLVVFLFPVLSQAFQLDWSGYYKANIVFVGHDNWDASIYAGEPTPFLFYDEQQLLLKSTARVSDGLQVQTNFLLGGISGPSVGNSETPDVAKDIRKLAGNSVSFIDSSRRKISFNSSKLQDIRLLPTHLYATYSNEFVQVDIGRQPFHFGLGMTYSDGFHPLAYVYDVRDAVAFKVQYESFYVKPYAMVYSQDEVAGFGASWAVAGGYEMENLSLEVLYKAKNYQLHNQIKPDFQPKMFVDSQTFNVYGEYKEGPVTASAEWGFMDNMENSAGFAQVSWDTSFYNVQLNLLGGYVSNDKYIVNINYDPTFMFWGYYYIVNGMDPRASGPNNCVIINPYARITLMDKHVISLYHTWISDTDTFNFKNHELALIAEHKLTEGFSWYNKLGALLKGTNLHDYGFKTEAIIRF